MGRATIRELRLHGSLQYFNPRPPCGGRRQALRRLPRVFAFQSTPSVGRATLSLLDLYRGKSISIHALRGEGDTTIPSSTVAEVAHFNPRPPWGGRHPTSSADPPMLLFQSTPSVGRATISARCNTRRTGYFNPRPPWGGRQDWSGGVIDIPKFQSTPSVGRATKCCKFMGTKQLYFNPRPPWGGRRVAFGAKHREAYFNPRPPWGGRPRSLSEISS